MGTGDVPARLLPRVVQTKREENASMASQDFGHLAGLLRSQQIARWETVYLKPPFELMSAITPTELEDVYTHKFIRQKLERSKAEMAALLAALTKSSWQDSDERAAAFFGMSFFSFSNRRIYSIYTSIDFAPGWVNGKPAHISGPLCRLMKEIVSREFL